MATRRFEHARGERAGVPGIIQGMNAAYRLMAANRFRLPGSTHACRLPDPATVGAAEGGVMTAPAPASLPTPAA
jgi:hypothetical protein